MPTQIQTQTQSLTQSHAQIQSRSANSPSLVRASFLTYLKTSFPYKKDWVHPCGETYSHSLISQRLKDYKFIEPQSYRALWYLWSCQGTRSLIANTLNFSGPTIKRRWDKSIDTILLMLFFPALIPDTFKLCDAGDW